jgi:hypothetical protein
LTALRGRFKLHRYKRRSPTVIDVPQDPDIHDVMREEKSRGKRRLDMKALRQREQLLKGFREALKLRTEREFLEAIRELGLPTIPRSCARL